jgi:hypothetical protein
MFAPTSINSVRRRVASNRDPTDVHVEEHRSRWAEQLAECCRFDEWFALIAAATAATTDAEVAAVHERLVAIASVPADLCNPDDEFEALATYMAYDRFEARIDECSSTLDPASAQAKLLLAIRTRLFPSRAE